MNYIPKMFAELSDTKHIGHGFAITARALEDEYASDFANIEWPTVDYAYAVYHDGVTENYLVARANADGEFLDEHGAPLFPKMTRVR